SLLLTNPFPPLTNPPPAVVVIALALLGVIVVTIRGNPSDGAFGFREFCMWVVILNTAGLFAFWTVVAAFGSERFLLGGPFGLWVLLTIAGTWVLRRSLVWLIGTVENSTWMVKRRYRQTAEEIERISQETLLKMDEVDRYHRQRLQE